MMNETNIEKYTAFLGQNRVAQGDLPTVVRGSKEALEHSPQSSLLVFENATSKQTEIDFRGTPEEVLARLTPAETKTEEAEPTEATKAGRPKLGVVPREVTLLPRHWEWLASQPGGASVTLRKLVEEARRNSQEADRARQAQESINRFMMVMAGNFVGFEEASRVLYRGDKARFEAIIGEWPHDIAEHLQMLAQNAPWNESGDLQD